MLLCVSCSSEPKGETSECDGVITAYCEDCGRFTEFKAEKTGAELRMEKAEADGKLYGFPLVLGLVTLMHTQAKQNVAWAREERHEDHRAEYFRRAAENIDRADAYLRGAMDTVGVK